MGTPGARGVPAAFREAEAVLVVNPLAEAMLSPYAKCVPQVVESPASTRSGSPGQPSEEAREPWAEGRSILLFAGLVDEGMKGFHVLHEACRRLWEKRRVSVCSWPQPTRPAPGM